MTSFKRALELITRYSRPCNRMQALLAAKSTMKQNSSDWLRLVGQLWTSCADVEDHADRLLAVLGSDGPIRDLMTAQENAKFDSLPNILAVYGREDGCCSWALDREMAHSLPPVRGCLSASGFTLTGIVRKEEVLALKLAGQSALLVSFGVFVTASAPAEQGPHRLL